MASRAGLSVDIIQTKLLYFRNYSDNAPISSHNILYADGSGGTYWSSLYIQNIPGFSSFYNSTLGLASSISYDATYGLSTFYASTVNAYGNSLSTFSTNFNGAFIPDGVYSTIAGLGSLGYISSQTLGRSLQSTLAGISPLFVSSVSTTQYKRLAVNIAPDAFEFVSSTKRVASFAYNGSLSIGPFAPATQLDVSGSALFRSPNGVYVYPGNISVGKNLGATINAELDISGSIIANNIYIQNRGIFNGPVTAAAYLTSSDSNLKTNINNYEPLDEAITNIRTVRFNWKDSGKDDIGFIAQELKEVVPEAVAVNDKGYHYIEPTKIIPLLVNTIKDLKHKYQELENRVLVLERNS
jgi:hypothetical protein